MGEGLYYLIFLVLAFQTQFINIMEYLSGRRTAGLNEHGNLLEIPFQPADYRYLKQDSGQRSTVRGESSAGSGYICDLGQQHLQVPAPPIPLYRTSSSRRLRPWWLPTLPIARTGPGGETSTGKLTEIQEQSFALDEEPFRATIGPSSPPHRLSRGRNSTILQQQLENQEAILRAEIETQIKSIRQRQRRINFSRIVLKHQKQLEDQERRGMLRSWSSPNIPSELYDSNFDLIKWKSMNESLDFRKGPEDIRKMLWNDKVCKLLDTFNHSMKIKKKTSVLHNSSFPLDPSQQGPMRETDNPHWNQTYSRSQHSTNDNGIRRSASSAQLDCDSNSLRVKKAKQDKVPITEECVASTSATWTATNQTRPSQNDNGIRRSASSAQLDCDSNSPRVKKAKQDKVPITEDDDGIRRSSAPEQPDHESDSPRDVSSLIAQHINAIRTATNQTRPSQGPIRDTDHPHWNQTRLRMQHSREMARLIPQFNNAVQIRTNQTQPSQSDNGIRRSASSAQPDCDSNSPRVKKANQD